MSWFEEANLKRINDPSYGYASIAREYGLTYEAVRSKFRREAAKSNIQSTPPEVKAIPEVESPYLDSGVYELINTHNERRFSIDFLCSKLKASPEGIQKAVEKLRGRGIQVIEEDDSYYICKFVVPVSNLHTKNWNGDRVIKFGVCTDPHLGSLYQQLTHLNSFYDLCEELGINDVYNCGDITDGVNMRVGHSFDCFAYGVDRQVNYTINHYPKRKRMTTYFITGNHDASAIKSAGHDIGRTIENEREDMKYLGCQKAVVMLTPNCSLQLSHPIDGSAYSLSYKVQRSLDAIMGGHKPSILAIGHYHKAFYMLYRNVHAFTAGCFQAQSPWMEGKQISAMMGGWIITVHVGTNGQINRFLPEFVPFYESIPNDFSNNEVYFK